MNRFYFLPFIFLLIFAACKKDSPEIPVDDVPTYEDPAKYESIFQATGCKVKNAATIKRYFASKDSVSNTTYIYGSRTLNDKEDFWISRYNASGDILWDTTYVSKQEVTANYAFALTKLNDDKFAIFQFSLRDNFLLSWSNVLIISSKTGRLASKVEFGNDTYSSIYSLKETFLVYNSPSELTLNPNAKNIILQVSKEGNIIKSPKLIKSIPLTTDYLLSDQSYLTLKGRYKISTIYNDTLWIAKDAVWSCYI